MITDNFIKLYETAFKECWSLPALTNYTTGKTYSYADLSKRVAKIHLMLDYLGISAGEKVALVAKDSAEWCMTYMALLTYGSIAVPILPDFSIDDIHNIINHSDARIVFSAGTHLEALSQEKMRTIEVVIDLEKLDPVTDLSLSPYAETLDANVLFESRYPYGFTKEDIRYKDISNDTTLLINYTSGTTGLSKGVVLTANNLAGNVVFGRRSGLIYNGDKVLCFIPMAHAYSCSFNFLTPLTVGAHIYILGAMPTPNVLLKAFADVRPNLIISVPLILEKIYKKLILPTISSGALAAVIKIPGIRNIVYKKICKKLYDALGGNFREFIVGGAAMSEEVTVFLHRIGFPFTIGYGMTECAPLISYVNHRYYVPLSCGKALAGIMEARIAPIEEGYGEPGSGEIQVRGENVCRGYYKNAEATQELFTSDKWLRTGDLGYIDKDGNIFIKGRCKSMILSSAGQNIYPEEIELKLNMMPCIMESLVLQQSSNKALVALVYPDYAVLKEEGIETPEQIEDLMADYLKRVNQSLATFERLSKIKVMNEEFEKNPKKSIKRYLYKL